MTDLELGNGLRVTVYDDYYAFRNDSYGMLCRIYFEDVEEFVKQPKYKVWGLRSNSNNISQIDIDNIIEYLNSGRFLIDDVIKLNNITEKEKIERLSAYPLRVLMDKLDKIKKEKEDKHEVESCC